MDVKLHDCFLSVDDHEKAIEFYRDALGFEVRNDVSAYGMRWVTVGPPSQPDINIVLEPPAADPGISAADREAIGDLLAKGPATGAELLDPGPRGDLRPRAGHRRRGGPGADGPVLRPRLRLPRSGREHDQDHPKPRLTPTPSTGAGDPMDEEARSSRGSLASVTSPITSRSEEPEMNDEQMSTRTTTATHKRSKVFTDEERAAMVERAQEVKAEARRGKLADKAAEEEAAVVAKIAEMPESDRDMGERIHALVKANAPALSPKLWYGMPAYAKDGKIVCFFQAADKFKSRYATIGFNEDANLDEGHMWPTSWALTGLTAADEAKIAALVRRAAS